MNKYLTAVRYSERGEEEVITCEPPWRWLVAACGSWTVKCNKCSGISGGGWLQHAVRGQLIGREISNMVVKVYGPARAACPQRVLLCLLEKEVEFELVHVDLHQGHQKHPDFLLRQPFGQVPVVEDADFRLFESRAIIRYYAAKYADRGPDLLGKTLEERALVEQWVEVEAHNFNNLCFTLMLQLVILPKMGKAGDLGLAKKCEEDLGKVLDVYEHRLSQSTYLAGHNFTLADLTHLPGIGHLIEEAKMGHLITQRNNVNAWWNKISSRPAWNKLRNLVQ
ncbi:Glutathione S-transferase F11, partial [Mucuna pruriens]